MQIGSSFASGCRRWFGGLAMAAAVIAVTPAHAETQIYSLFDFQFEDGTVMPELRIAYETQGTLAPNRDNAILLLHETLRDHHAFDEMVGPGKVFDTNKYFVIAADAIGSGESSSPGDGSGQDFPRYTIRDVMAAEYGLVSSGLGLAQLRAIVGRSMGAFVGLEWAVQHPEMPARLVLMAPSARSDANYQVIIDLMTSAIALDPDWNGGHYERNPVEGLRHAGMTYFPWSVSAAYLDRISATQLSQKSEAIAKSFAAWDANSLVLRLAACREHDVGAAFPGGLSAALGRVTMPVLLMPGAGDRLIDPANAQRLRAALPHATYAEIPGDLGHRAIAPPSETPEAEFVERAIHDFLGK
jgi:homoserine O-acetyltransferase/O-succinyltransferase